MLTSPPTSAARRWIVALAAFAALGSSLAFAAGSGVTLLEPVEFAKPGSVSSALAMKIARLARIDPAQPVSDDTDTQTLSMFGREDLIAGISNDYHATRCAASPMVVPVMDEIARRARDTSIVIVNESHERSEHRSFIEQVATRLRPLGYDTLAVETLSNWSPATPARYRPPFTMRPELAYFEDEDGFYLSEAAFGRLGRRAKRLGYRLIPYEPLYDPSRGTMTRDRQIAVREEGQAAALASYFKDHPDTKLLVHVGYSHAAEVPRLDGARWMAARLKAMTGVDPLTVSQTTCRGGGTTTHLAALPADQPAGTFDLVVDHPQARFVRGRPAWRQRMGDRLVTIPAALRPTAGWRVVEARPVGEPVASVPMDRVAIRPGENIALSLPPGRYRLRIIDPTTIDPMQSTSPSAG